jgi:hypothetical protein
MFTLPTIFGEGEGQLSNPIEIVIYTVLIQFYTAYNLFRHVA